jgi:hypothetical protein
MCRMSLKPKSSLRIFLGSKPVLIEFVTPRVLQPTPLKKNLVPRFRARNRKGKLDFTSSRDYQRRLHRFEDYNTRGSRGIAAKNN